MKPILTLITEAFVVGILLVGLYFIISKYYKPLQAVFLSGAIVHLLCELTGVNAWYANTYY